MNTTTPSGPTAITRATPHPTWRAWTVSLAVIIGGSFVTGMATSWGQLLLPDAFRSLANSAGGWSAIAFTLVWATRCSPVLGAVGGMASFVMLNLGYSIASLLRGYQWTLDLDNFWFVVSFVAGPVIGIAAAWLRSRSVWLVAVGAAALSAVLIGDGIWGLTAIADTTSPVYWWISIASGAIFLGAVAWRRMRRAAPIAVAIAIALAGALMQVSVFRFL